MAELDAQFANAVEITAQDLRHAYERPLGEGVEGYSDMRVTPGASAASVDVTSGVGFVRGDGLNDLGLYRCRNDATKNSGGFEAGGITAPDATNPRLDQIIARIYDDDVDNEGQRKWRLAVLTGTPRSGETLDKREGAAALPNSAMLLADVLVPSGAPTVLKAENIRDRRPFCYPIVPPLKTRADLVPLEFLPGASGPQIVDIFHSQIDNRQAAAAVLLPRRIIGATRMRWRYLQEAVEPMVGNYTLALYDASARKIVDTGPIAFNNTPGIAIGSAETIAANTFDAGLYYLLFGIDSTAGGLHHFGVEADGRSGPDFSTPNQRLYRTIGGTTAPATLSGFTDSWSVAETAHAPGVPQVALSVG